MKDAAKVMQEFFFDRYSELEACRDIKQMCLEPIECLLFGLLSFCRYHRMNIFFVQPCDIRK